MTVAKIGDKVKVHYTGKLNDGTVFDSSLEREPLEFKLGEGQMIAGFEKAVTGLETGSSVTTNIPSDEAYGERKKEMMVEVPKKDVPENIEPQVGQQLAIQQEDGNSLPVVVTAVEDNKIVLDANHPLAGKDLTFEIKLVDVV